MIADESISLSVAYWLDVWNWIDNVTVALVISSSISFIRDDHGEGNDRLLIATGFFQFLLLISFLKKTFFPFTKFVSGLIKVSESVMRRGGVH